MIMVRMTMMTVENYSLPNHTRSHAAGISQLQSLVRTVTAGRYDHQNHNYDDMNRLNISTSRQRKQQDR